MKGEKVLLGMSGGVDSSMAIKVLQDQGFVVYGFTLKTTESFCDRSAKKVAQAFSIQHQTLDVTDDFKNKVERYFIDSYKKGETPSPCAFCNDFLKFPVLKNIANKMGVRYIATGHYVRTFEIGGGVYIQKGVDTLKDQSYYLWRLNSNLLKNTLFPLGNKTKLEVKTLAKALGFDDLASKNESMGVCFLDKMDYREYLKRNDLFFVEEINEGEVRLKNEEVIGRHKGFPYYTIGQKNGFDLFEPRSLYVTEIDIKKNILYVDFKDNLKRKSFYIRDLHFQKLDDIKSNNITVKVRGLGLNPEGNAQIRLQGNAKAEICLENPAWAIAPGQPVVFYKNDLVIGGGIAEGAWSVN